MIIIPEVIERYNGAPLGAEILSLASERHVAKKRSTSSLRRKAAKRPSVIAGLSRTADLAFYREGAIGSAVRFPFKEARGLDSAHPSRRFLAFLL
jgi:hypothetical protein